MVYFVDDLNLPEVDKYMTQSAIALLRQQMEYGHIYDMTKLAQNPVPTRRPVVWRRLHAIFMSRLRERRPFGPI